MLHIYIYDISTLRVNDLTLILLTWRKWLAPNNASRQQMGFNSGFKGLKSDNNNGYFTRRHKYTCGNISLSSSRMRNVSDNVSENSAVY